MWRMTAYMLSVLSVLHLVGLQGLDAAQAARRSSSSTNSSSSHPTGKPDNEEALKAAAGCGHHLSQLICVAAQQHSVSTEVRGCITLHYIVH
jgi:hypothetical protein